jgi:hypothetical protein
MRYHLTPVRVAIIKTQNINNENVAESIEKLEYLYSVCCWWECKTVLLLLKTVWGGGASIKLKLCSNPTSGCLPKTADCSLSKKNKKSFNM